MIFEHKALYSRKFPVPSEDYLIEFGQAAVVRKGNHVTAVATANMVLKTAAAAAQLSEEGISVEVIDPRTLVPLDKATILESVEKTGRLVIVDEAFQTCGFAAEVAAIVASEALDSLDAPIRRVTMPDTPHPFSPGLEQALIPSSEKICLAIKRVIEE